MRTDVVLGLVAFACGSILGGAWAGRQQAALPESRFPGLPEESMNAGQAGPPPDPGRNEPATPSAERTGPATSERAARLSELKSRIPALIQGRDGEGLLTVVRELAAFGTVAFPEMAQALSAPVLDGTLGDYDLDALQYHKVLGATALGEFALWALENQGISTELRLRILEARSAFWTATERNSLLLSLFRNERNPEMQFRFLQGVRRPTPDQAADLMTGWSMIAADAQAAGALFGALAGCPTPEVVAFLRAHESDADPLIAASARVNRLIASPPAQGMLVTGDSHEAFRPGDVIVAAAGTPTGNRREWKQARETAVTSGEIEVVVDRDGERLTLTVPSLPRSVLPVSPGGRRR